MKVLLLKGSPRKNGCTPAATECSCRCIKARRKETEVFQASDRIWKCKAAAAKLKRI